MKKAIFITIAVLYFSTSIFANGVGIVNAQLKKVLRLQSTSVEEYQFLPKIWAKEKIEYLFVQYYSLEPDSPEAEAIKEEIISISVNYGVITEFTSFQGGDPTGIEEEMENNGKDMYLGGYKLPGNYPNPFNPTTRISFAVSKELHREITIKIFNSLGELVRTLRLTANGNGIYEITWDGKFTNGESAPSDVYIYTIDFGDAVLAGKMILMK